MHRQTAAKCSPGWWCHTTLNQDLAATLVDGVQPKKEALDEQLPMGRVYSGSDGRWFIVMMPFREDHYWPLFCGAIGKPEWAASPGAYDSGRKRARARKAIGEQLEAVFATRPMAEWLAELDAAGCIAGPVAELPEVCQDPQLRANGAFEEVIHSVGPRPHGVRTAAKLMVGPHPTEFLGEALLALKRLCLDGAERLQVRDGGRAVQHTRGGCPGAGARSGGPPAGSSSATFSICITLNGLRP